MNSPNIFAKNFSSQNEPFATKVCFITFYEVLLLKILTSVNNINFLNYRCTYLFSIILLIFEEKKNHRCYHLYTCTYISQFSVLDGQASVPALVDKAIEDGMPGLAITDHGNMFGIKEFYNYAKKKNGIK